MVVLSDRMTKGSNFYEWGDGTGGLMKETREEVVRGFRTGADEQECLVLAGNLASPLAMVSPLTPRPRLAYPAEGT